MEKKITIMEKHNYSDLEHLELVARRIAESGADITRDYQDWINVTFACASLGEAAREHYHTICSQYPGYKREECDKCFDNCLRTGRGDIRLGTLIKMAKDHGIDTSLPRGRRPKADNEKRKEKENLFQQMSEKSAQWYDTRFNTWKNRVEICKSGTNQWAPMTDRDHSTIFARLQGSGLNVKKNDVMSLMESRDYSKDYDVVRTWLDGLPTYRPDTDPDYIADFFGGHLEYTDSENADFYQRMLTKWFVGMVALWTGKVNENPIMPVFCGEQHIGKTYFIRHILPPELRDLLLEVGPSQYIDKDLTRIPQMFMPYKEVLQIMENGLQVPDDVTIIWCDDNYGYMTRLSDAAQQQRSGGAGVYYHLSYAGQPHDHLWLTTTQPGLIYHEMMEAYRHNVRKAWIANVHDPKVAAYDLEFFLDLAWNVHGVQPGTVQRHLEAWLTREYGQAAAAKAAPALQEFYRLCAMRRPEFMGWSQVELRDRERYPGGLSPVRNTEFSFSEFGNEAQRYIDRFRAVRRTLDEAAALVPARSRDAWFAAVAYPVGAAASHAEKLLYAQLARERTRNTYGPGIWKPDSVMLAAAALSQHAYQDVRNLTRYYNETLAEGRWRGIMCDHPRDLFVFWAPNLPVTLPDAEIAQWLACGRTWHAPEVPAAAADYFAANACDYVSASVPVQPVQNLGHSGRAVPVPKGGALRYDFRTEMSGRAVVRVAVIPTQALDKGDIRFSVSVDGGTPQVVSIQEPYRSDRWKENVTRGQAVVTVPVELAAGAHTLTLAATDDHILFDQWMVDFKPERRFYLFPI